MDWRLQDRYVKLVKAHMSSSTTTTVARPSVLPEHVTAQAATQAAWQFFYNARVTLEALIKLLRQAVGNGCGQSDSDYVLLLHDCSNVESGKHRSKEDLRQFTDALDLGYDMTNSLHLDAASGNLPARMLIQVALADTVCSTAQNPSDTDARQLDQLQPTMDEVDGWSLPRQVVHVVDREADALGYFRRWAPEGYFFGERGEERRVLGKDERWLISEMEVHFDQSYRYPNVRSVNHLGQKARLEVAEAEVVRHRARQTRMERVQKNLPGASLRLRLVLSRVADDEGYLLADWYLLTKVFDAQMDASQSALWYHRQLRIESLFNLLKSLGQQLEYWQQTTGIAIIRRFLVTAMACVIIRDLERQSTPHAQEFKKQLIQFSGRRMKRGVQCASHAVLAGYFSYFAMTQWLADIEHNLRKLKSLAKATWPFLGST